jgi:hypothetical protein
VRDEEMSITWQEFMSYSDLASAEVAAGLLRNNGVPVQLVLDEPIPGLVNRVLISVPTDLLHRAKWITSQAQPTEAELIFFATGKLEAGDNTED